MKNHFEGNSLYSIKSNIRKADNKPALASKRADSKSYR